MIKFYSGGNITIELVGSQTIYKVLYTPIKDKEPCVVLY